MSILRSWTEQLSSYYHSDKSDWVKVSLGYISCLIYSNKTYIVTNAQDIHFYKV